MMFQSTCVLGLWMLIVFLLCQRGIDGFQYGQETCSEDKNINDVCHDGAGTCKSFGSGQGSNQSVIWCVPSNCGDTPAVENGLYEESDCFNVYKCATLVCDGGYQMNGGAAWLQCWFDGWSDGVGAPVAAKCSTPEE